MRSLSLKKREHYRDTDDINIVAEKYTPLFELIKKETKKQPITIPIFTTNYDNIIEDFCCQDDNFNLIDGVRYVKGHRGGILDFREFEKLDQLENKINVVLLKLHGSICWEWDDKKKIIRVNPKPIDDLHDPEVYKFYIAPTKEKIASDHPYRELYEYLHRCLDNAKLFIIIGYSFRDYDSLTKIKSSLDFNEDLKIIILNDKAEDLKKLLFGDYGNRVIPIPCFFGSDDEAKYLALIQEEIKKIRSDNPQDRF